MTHIHDPAGWLQRPLTRHDDPHACPVHASLWSIIQKPDVARELPVCPAPARDP
jgi:hypothetical protein